MDFPNMSFHVRQILSALNEISNHLHYLPDPQRDTISASLAQLSTDFSEMVSDFELQSGDQTLAEEFAASDKTTDLSPFVRTEMVDLFDNYIALNADGIFTYANPTAFTFFGRPDRDLKGRMIWEVLPDLRQGPFYPSFQEAVETRKPVQIEMQGVDSRWFAISIHPTLKSVIIYWLDITDKKRIEEALMASEERLRAAIETAPINVFTLDHNLRYVWIGPRKDGLFHEPVLGKRDDEILPAQDAAILMEAEQYVLDTGKGLRKEVRYHKNGQSVIYVMAIEPLFDRMKGVVGLTVAVMDVTTQRRLEAERQDYAAQMELQRRLIEHSEMERIELARNLHDGPIQSLVGLGFSLQLIKDLQKADRRNGDAELHQMGIEIKNAVAELRGFCNELRPPVLSRLGLRRALMENIEGFNRRNHPQIQISLDFPENLQHIPDPVALALYRIYQHGISNIVRHAEASEVWVRCRVDQREIIFEIQDNGSGLSGPVDWVAYARDGHLGIVGMKERAEAVGGALQLISEPGEGTVVQVIVPLPATEQSESA